MTTMDDARAEAERRYLVGPRRALPSFEREAFAAGAEWQASRKADVTEAVVDALVNHVLLMVPDPEVGEVASCGCGWGENPETLDPDSDPVDSWREHLHARVSAALGGGE